MPSEILWIQTPPCYTYGCLPFLYILAAVSTLENVHPYWYW